MKPHLGHGFDKGFSFQSLMDKEPRQSCRFLPATGQEKEIPGRLSPISSSARYTDQSVVKGCGHDAVPPPPKKLFWAFLELEPQIKPSLFGRPVAQPSTPWTRMIAWYSSSSFPSRAAFLPCVHCLSCPPLSVGSSAASSSPTLL
jgi:hypothetical protein